MRNQEALNKLRDQLVFKPETHDQATWGQGQAGQKMEVVELIEAPNETLFGVDLAKVDVACASSACAAGWAVALEGDVMLYFENHVRHQNESQTFTARADFCQSKDGTVHRIAPRAIEVLGITKAQGNVLFQPEWTTEEVIEMVDVLRKDDLNNSQATKELKQVARRICAERDIDEDDWINNDLIDSF